MPKQPSDQSLLLAGGPFSILDDWEAITGCHFNRTLVLQPRVDFAHLAGLA